MVHAASQWFSGANSANLNVTSNTLCKKWQPCLAGKLKGSNRVKDWQTLEQNQSARGSNSAQQTRDTTTKTWIAYDNSTWHASKHRLHMNSLKATTSNLNKAFKICDDAHSLTTRDTSYNGIRQIVLIWTLESPDFAAAKAMLSPQSALFQLQICANVHLVATKSCCCSSWIVA